VDNRVICFLSVFSDVTVVTQSEKAGERINFDVAKTTGLQMDKTAKLNMSLYTKTTVLNISEFKKSKTFYNYFYLNHRKILTFNFLFKKYFSLENKPPFYISNCLITLIRKDLTVSEQSASFNFWLYLYKFLYISLYIIYLSDVKHF
jgi:hypothetical protein